MCYGLGLREREEQDVTALDLGNIYHSILEKLVEQMLHDRADWSAISKAQIQSLTREVGQSLRGELMLSSARNQYLLQRVQRTVDQVVASQRAAGARAGFKPRWTELGFGLEGSELPALELSTPNSNAIHLHGKIDRVDVLEEQAAFAVIDYKLRGDSLSLDQVYHGISLQLITYLLVLQLNGERLEGKKLTPAAAFYVKLLRQLEDVKHPAEADDPADPAFDLKVKPRGILNVDFLHDLDTHLAAGATPALHVRLTKNGAVGWKSSSDAADASEFAALINHVRLRIGELADQIIAGNIDVKPYRMNDTTPCPHCEFRCVCRFELPTNRYLPLEALGREERLRQLTQSNGGAHAGH
jgi:ATP-dependent helicase/nuclease subunit B